MNFLDIIILVPAIWFGYKGFRRGLIIALATLAALLLGTYLGVWLSDALGGWMESSMGADPRYASAIAFAVIFIAVIILMHLLGKALEKVVDMVALGFVNKLAGAAFGLLKAVLILSLLFYLVEKFDVQQSLIRAEHKENSLLYRPVSGLAPALVPIVNRQLEEIRKNPQLVPDDNPEQEQPDQPQ